MIKNSTFETFGKLWRSEPTPEGEWPKPDSTGKEMTRLFLALTAILWVGVGFIEGTGRGINWLASGGV